MSTLLNNVRDIIQASNHKFCTVSYIFEKLNAPDFATDGELNVAIIEVARDKDQVLPITLETGYVSLVSVREEYKEKVQQEFLQDRVDLAFAKNELENTESGFVYAYCVR